MEMDEEDTATPNKNLQSMHGWVGMGISFIYYYYYYYYYYYFLVLHLFSIFN